MKTLPIQLNALEVIHLSDAIAGMSSSEKLLEEDSYLPLARKALLTLGSAYRELVGPAGYSQTELSLQVTEEQVWLFRSKTRTGDLGIDNQTNIGIPLLRKIYDLLLQFNSDLPEITMSTKEQELDDRAKKFLGLLKEELNARAAADSDTNPYKGS